jgi:hypothetical protein
LTRGSCSGYGIRLVNLPGVWPPDRPTPSVSEFGVDFQLWRPSGEPEFWWSRLDHLFEIGWSYEARYRLLTDENRIEIGVGPVSERLTAVSLVVAVLPLLLPAFGLEPLHGASVALSGGAVLILGAAGAGKSTTALSLLRAGGTFLADDVCALDANGSLWPGPPLIGALGDGSGVVIFEDYYGKTIRVPERHDPSPHDVATVVILAPSPGAPLQVQPITGAQAFEELVSHVRAPSVLPEIRRQHQLERIAIMARKPVRRLSYDRADHSPEAVASAIAKCAAEG